MLLSNEEYCEEGETTFRDELPNMLKSPVPPNAGQRVEAHLTTSDALNQ